jgi:hypothetical protein
MLWCVIMPACGPEALPWQALQCDSSAYGHQQQPTLHLQVTVAAVRKHTDDMCPWRTHACMEPTSCLLW